MPTKRETILAALTDLLGTIPYVRVLRGDLLPERIPKEGLLILRDGTPGEPGVTLSPLAYHFQHRAELEVVMQSSRDLDMLFDELLAQINAVISAERTLCGLCDWVEAEAAEPVDLPIEGAVPIKAGLVGITLHYASGNSLG